MKLARWRTGIALLVLAGGAAAQAVSLYELEGFAGRRFDENGVIQNFANVGFNDRASSVVIRAGQWQFCTDAYFRGRCVTLNPGQYPNLGAMGLSNQISSARPVGGGVGGGGGFAGGSLTLFDNYNLAGQGFAVTTDVDNFASLGYNDRARSMVVNAGQWELCRNASYGGDCQVYGPGRYPNLGPLAGEISSARRMAGGGGGGHWPDGWGNGVRVILYEAPNFGGRSFVITQDVIRNLDGTGFNDRASSLRVERGYWIFCTEANFGGECRTLGPGDYPTTPYGMNNAISSGRRISNQYPYNSNPDFMKYSQQ